MAGCSESSATVVEPGREPGSALCPKSGASRPQGPGAIAAAPAAVPIAPLLSAGGAARTA